MNYQEYRQECLRTATFDGTAIEEVCMLCMGLAGETGEVIDYIKKSAFQGHDLEHGKLINEFGDLIWYLTVLLNYFHIDIEKVYEANIDKLRKRYPDGFSEKDSIARRDLND